LFENNTSSKLRNFLVAIKTVTEFIFIETFRENNKNLIVGSIYRPPGNNLTNFNDTSSIILSNLKKTNIYSYTFAGFTIQPSVKIQH